MATLIVKDKKTKMVPVGDDVVTIGRSPSSALQLGDTKVSREHCKIEKRGDEFWIQDLGSSNGTVVNGFIIDGSKKLKEGDEIKLGKIRMLFTLKEADEAAAADITVESAGEVAKYEGVSPQYESLVRDHQNLTTLYEVNRLIRSVFDLDELLQKILDVVLKVIKAERGFIVLRNEDTGELVPKAVRNRDVEEISISRTIANKIFETGESILTQDAMSDDRFASGKSIVDYHIRSCLCVPLKSRNKVLGILHVDNKVSARSFSEEDLELLSTIGAEAGVILENARLYEENLRAERLAAIGQTIAGLSHYIKNILTGVEGGAALVDMGLDKENQELLRKGWKIVRSSDERISQLVLNMLDFSKERKPVREKSSVNDIVKDVASLMEHRCAGKSVKIKTACGENVPEIDIDPTGIHRSILNLVSNAIDAVEEGKGEIVITTLVNPLSRIQISISDNGCGIPEESLSHVFDLFHSTKGAKGTGLGLAVTKKIIDEHDGEIKVDSKAGQGTTFTIELGLL